MDTKIELMRGIYNRADAWEKSYVPWPKRFMRAMKKLRKECPGEGYPHRRLAEMKDV